jgi:DnaJ-domain-containing protein 1
MALNDLPPPPPDASDSSSNAFAVLGIEPTFDLDARRLRSVWMRRAAAVHPDSAGAAHESAAVNESYRCLLDPRSRAIALLALLGAPTVDQRAVPEGFLIEMMELRELADGVRQDPVGAESLRRRARDASAEALERIRGVFARVADAGWTEECAREVWMQLNVLRAFERMLEQLDREGLGA